MIPEPKRSFVDALRGLMKEYSENKHNQKMEMPPKEGQEIQQRQGTGQWTRVCQKDMAPSKTLKIRKTYRNNRYKLNHNLCMQYPNFLSVCTHHDSCNENENENNNDNQELVILTKQTLTQAQKDVLKKGLSFIPKPKKLNIHQLYNDLRLFMHRMKCKFEFHNKPQQTKTKDPLILK